MAAFSIFHSVHALTRPETSRHRAAELREAASRAGAAAAETALFVWTVGVLAWGFLVTVGFFER